MKAVFMGTPDFAVPILERLIKAHEVLAVITQPDKPKGRGNKVLFTPVKECAVKNDIPVLQPITIKDVYFIEELEKYGADIFVVAAYGQILPEKVLNMPKYGSINVHGSLLPKYRGAAPIQRAVIDGEKTTGVTIMQMDRGLDTGDMILQKNFEILPQDTSADVFDKMAAIGADALIEALAQIQNGTATMEKQNDAHASYAKMIAKETGRIDWRQPSAHIVNLIRGLNPWPVAYTLYEDSVLKIWRAEEIPSDKAGVPGEILGILKNRGFIVRTGDTAVLVTEVQAVGSKKMSAADYLRGHSVEPGRVL